MNTQTVRGLLLSLVIGALMAAGVLFAAAAAKATPERDYVYYSVLHNNGFTIYSPQVMKRNAQIVCAQLAAGYDWRLVVTKIMSEADYDLDSAALIASAAIVAYCPEHTPAELQQGTVT